jgi:hypothetical protein
MVNLLGVCAPFSDRFAHNLESRAMAVPNGTSSGGTRR